MRSSIGFPELLVLGTLCLLGFALFLLVAALRGKQSRSVQRALIDKLSATELSSLLQTPYGEKLVQTLSESVSPGRSILTAVRRGIVAIAGGIGLVLAGSLTQAPSIVPGTGIVIVFLGLGLLVAAFVAYRLSTRWHLLEGYDSSASKPHAD